LATSQYSKNKKTQKNAIFLDVTLCGSCKNQHFGGIYCLHYQAEKNQQARNTVSSNFFFIRSILQLLVTANVVTSWLILFIADDGGDMFLRNIGSCKSRMASHPRRWHSS
jgi:hypothetical protein